MGRRRRGLSTVRGAAAWIAAARPVTTEDRAFQLLGLTWTAEKPGQKTQSMLAAGAALIALQGSDGGWAQLPTLASDAYATGQVLMALKTAGILSSNQAVYQRGVQFLLRTQSTNGAWYVRSRAIPLQPYFDSGFPYGPDQFISAAATNWAVMALTN